MKTFFDYQSELWSDFRYLPFTNKIVFLLFVLLLFAPVVASFIAAVVSGLIATVVMQVLQLIMAILKD